MQLKAYLEQHFVDKPTFAALAEVSVPRLEELIDCGAIPRATYTCDGSSIRSAAFGRSDVHDAPKGEYFRPECVRWARIADEASPGSEQSAVLAALGSELRVALREFVATDHEGALAIEGMVQNYLPSFWDGTFGLCVADPSNGEGIVRKETLQAKLTAITENGSNAFPEGISRDELLRLIDDYADAAMPFSPAEYELSSRKRLVDDLRPMVAHA